MTQIKEEKSKNKSITKRTEDYSQWYLDVIEAADLAENGPVRGTMVIKPYGYAIWENIQKVLDEMFKKTGVENAYFPLFIPESFLKREAEHVEGFSPELAVVTHAGGKKLEEPLIVRPTSETIINEMFSKWVHSYRDLPLLINQWCNIVRWEMRPRLFLRTTEFLWQEGHTAHLTEKEADDRAKQMLEVYRAFVEDYLAIPAITGIKSEAEKFAGALRTYTIEAMMQDKKALQMGTSHNLGQNFAKPFNIKYLNENNKEQYVWQTSWGVSTRLIGGLIMAHSDDVGLIVPPKIAPIQVVLVTIWKSNKDKEKVLEKAKEIMNNLQEDNIRVKIDERGEMRPGPRYYEWLKKGIPIRLGIGEQELSSGEIKIQSRVDSLEVMVIKDFNDKKEIQTKVKKVLEEIQKYLYNKALSFREHNAKKVNSWGEFKKAMEGESGFLEAHWCGSAKCEEKIKEETKATIRCIAFNQKKEKGKCIYCDKTSDGRVIFAKSY